MTAPDPTPPPPESDPRRAPTPATSTSLAAADIDKGMAVDSETAPNAPRNLRELFWAFNALALQGFGGVLAVAQQGLVDQRGWLTPAQFLEVLSVSQVLPGPNIVNLGLIVGDRFFGLRGAFTAMAGMLVVPLALVLTLTALYAEFSHHPMVAGALRGMGAVAAGLVLATAIKLSAGLRRNPMGQATCAGFIAATTFVIGGLRWPLAGVLLGFGSLAIAVAWRRLR
ncbi:MAG: chromate transporter [Burkholderiaceae bacterium]